MSARSTNDRHSMCGPGLEVHMCTAAISLQNQKPQKEMLGGKKSHEALETHSRIQRRFLYDDVVTAQRP